ncbi:glucose-6-phosphate isomerase [Candidatus Kapabacteria bacterium]|nr:glucose-6-phosphate isomerase [Candidatus Kapabacteria bacterium]
MSKLTESIQWQTLVEHQFNISSMQLRDAFHYDEDRFEKYSIKIGKDLIFDYSKNLMNFDTISHFLALAKSTRLKFAINDMFAGKKINSTENRSVLHVALRDSVSEDLEIDGLNIKNEVDTVKLKMQKLSKDILDGNWLGHTGKQITDLVNIGIGGSDLGPRMVCNSLTDYHKHVKVHFVANVDRRDINKIMLNVNPETTIFVITSKSFSTQETLQNAETAKNWMIRSGVSKENLSKHFIAISNNIKACTEFGIAEDNILKMWDWVGGRFSLWSAAGLSIAIQIGWRNFEKLLKGANQVDTHFQNTPLENNIPFIMAILSIWYRNFLDFPAQAIIPYNQDLGDFSAYLQQLEMESNGKSVSVKNQKLDYQSSSIIFGEPGTNSQHSFFQMLHQGTTTVPVDFIGFAEFDQGDKHNQKLLSNLLAQSRALMIGKTKNEVKLELKEKGLSEKDIENNYLQRTFTGNKPTNTILFKELNPKNLGSLIALYEHKTFVIGSILGINSFDQWGVELGKEMANQTLDELNSKESSVGLDNSTNGLINWIKS